MSNKNFIITFCSTSLSLLIVICLMNYFVDPGKIYSKSGSDGTSDKDIFDTFNKSTYGVKIDLNERNFVRAIAKHSDKKACAIIGSSHTLLVSSIMSKSVHELCPTLINLSVSGGTIEDIFISIEYLYSHGQLPDKIIIGIDPWTFKWNMGIKFKLNESYLNSFLDRNNIDLPLRKGSTIKPGMMNLINAEYTILSVKEILTLFEEQMEVEQVNDDPITNRKEFDVKLKDGSLLNRASYIDQPLNENYSATPDYLLGGEVVDKTTIDAIKLVIEKLKGKVEFYFIHTPYHHSSFHEKYSEYRKYFDITQEHARDIALKLDVKIIGSFYPDKVGCNKEEFFDFMHPRISCIDKVFKHINSH